MESIARLRLALLAAIFLFMLNACEPPQKKLRLVRPPLELDLEIALKMETLIDKSGRIDIVLVDPPEEGMSPLDTVEAGYADLAFATNVQEYRESINVILPVYLSVLHIVTSTDPPPDSLLELFRGHTIFAGPPGSITRRIVREIASDLGLAEGEYQLITATDIDADVVMLFAPIDRERIIADPRIEGMRMFSLGDPNEIGTGSGIDRATLLNPRLRAFVIPAGVYDAATPEPVLTVASDKLLVARGDLPTAAVYDLFSEVVRTRTALFGERPELFQPLDKSMVDANFAFAVHPGALAYLNQDEPTYIERYSGVAEVLVTLLVAVVSGGYALVKIYKIRRKNRIDRYYVEVLRIRDAVPEEAGMEERRGAVAKLRALEDQAFAELVNEQLAADESFRIFVELTNNTIDGIMKQNAGRAAG